MRVLVLGGSYFIGRTLVNRLLHDGHDVTLLNRGSKPVVGVEQLLADRSHAGEMRGLLAGRSFDWVIDTSCYTAAEAAIAVDALGGRFTSWLYLSTAAVYPGGTSHRLTEGDVGPGREWEDYGWNKLAAERELQRAFAGTDARLAIVRPPYVYGALNTLPRERWLWARMLQHKPIWMPGAGTTPLHFIHVDDLADAMVTVLAETTLPLEIFNVAQQDTPSIREYLAVVGEVAGVVPQVQSVDYAALAIEARSFFPFRDYPCLLSTDAIASAHGWRARFGMLDGLAQTFAQLDRAAMLTADTALDVEARLLASLG